MFQTELRMFSSDFSFNNILTLVPCCCSVKGPELINMYVGQSEENIREGWYRVENPPLGRRVMCFWS